MRIVIIAVCVVYATGVLRCSGLEVGESGDLDTNVTVENGQCGYWGKTINDTKSWSLRSPCARVTCYVAASAVLRINCAEVDPQMYGSNCYEHKEVGAKYPRCCPRVFCHANPGQQTGTPVKPRSNLTYDEQ